MGKKCGLGSEKIRRNRNEDEGELNKRREKKLFPEKEAHLSGVVRIHNDNALMDF